jgi:heme-degrading monooxygenase HmoA
MFMRFVQLKIQPDQMAEFERFYMTRIEPALEATVGCLFVGLLSEPEQPSECVSMTLWRSPDDVQAYEAGLYGKLLEEADQFFWHSTEWRVRLSDDLTLEYAPVKEPPEVEAYPIEAASGGGEPIDHASANMYLRVVTGNVLAGKMDALSERYRQVVIPALRSVDGCRYAYLAKGNADTDEVLSVTLWDSRSKAMEYERHGRFRELLAELQPMLSSVLQWQMTLNPSQKTREIASNDVHIEGYQVVTSDSF